MHTAAHCEPSVGVNSQICSYVNAWTAMVRRKMRTSETSNRLHIDSLWCCCGSIVARMGQSLHSLCVCVRTPGFLYCNVL